MLAFQINCLPYMVLQHSVFVIPNYNKKKRYSCYIASSSFIRSVCCQKQHPPQEDSCPTEMSRREIILRTSEIALFGSIFSFSKSEDGPPNME
ncbi:unnamed protein product [Cuscuta europaea]|uniref:Uncharacterized protein n=1 Tax=Cuscuta europaea TaxID=41803 RepID=A0A9P0ZDT7_CUSEU|nr:unnamed protein product [Cuscuta europaea]